MLPWLCLSFNITPRKIFSKEEGFFPFFFFLREDKSKLEKEASADIWRQTDDKMGDMRRRNRGERRGGDGGGGEKDKVLFVRDGPGRTAAAGV